jgi:two-component system cell cycle sensor histidine kinase/response regulator CckA
LGCHNNKAGKEQLMAESLVKPLETILVVDDMEMVRELVVGILKTAKFQVLQANNGEDAIKVAADHAGRIDLLLSDVQMPGMTGPDLGAALKKSRPDMHMMFMSGFTGGNLLVLNYGWAFIEKPFIPEKLMEMVNVVLHTPDKSQGGRQYDTRGDTGKPEEGQTPKEGT